MKDSHKGIEIKRTGSVLDLPTTTANCNSQKLKIICLVRLSLLKGS